MASTDEKKPQTEASESGPPPPPSEKVKDPPPPPAGECSCSIIDVGLRVLLFASTLAAVIVMVTSKQTVRLMIPGSGIPFPVPVEGKFNNSPAFTYFVAALSVACLYSIITILVSISVILKPVFATSFLLFLIIWDAIFLGIVASATGAAAGVGYIGWKGNKHAMWGKVCDDFDKFCQHLAGSIPLGLLAAIILVLLVALSASSIHKKIPK